MRDGSTNEGILTMHGGILKVVPVENDNRLIADISRLQAVEVRSFNFVATPQCYRRHVPDIAGRRPTNSSYWGWVANDGITSPTIGHCQPHESTLTYVFMASQPKI